MSTGFYPKLALTSMKKNKRLYLPYILTCTGMVMMEYIIGFLSVTPVFDNMPGSGSLQMILQLGAWVIAVFSVIFLFYTNSFLMRRRKKEFGLYNILGMGKFNIARVLFWETLLTAAASLAAGLGAGIAASKLAELSLTNMMEGQVTYSISVSFEAIGNTVMIFCLIFVLILINSLIRIKLSNPIAMLNSENYGEKQPKANWALGVLGLAFLCTAYYMAVSIQDPLSALMLFFIAVIMVIIGTYLLFVAGSVVLCRLLQKNKRYYYKANHFVSVSSMAYRMKRNGAGLASICILGTMVLVMTAFTSCLYFGSEDSLNSRYPREINTDISFAQVEDMNEQNIEILREKAENATAERGAKMKDIIDYRYAAFFGVMSENGKVTLNVDNYTPLDRDSTENTYQFYFIPLDDYNRMTGNEEKLESGQVLAYSGDGDFDGGMLEFEGGAKVETVRVLDEFMEGAVVKVSVVPSVFIVTDDFDGIVGPLYDEVLYGALHWECGYNTGLSDEEGIRLNNELEEIYGSMAEEGDIFYRASCESLAENRVDFYGTYSSLFFLGVMLSIVFIFAAVLIIYYKQISEGYEDQSRFDIMKKVGMTEKDIRKSINSQLLTVFFLPLCMAGLHLAFAFPLLNKMLMLFNLLNARLLVMTTVISFMVFALFYMIVYRITSNAYYKIVAGR